MNRRALKEIILSGESSTVEFKRKITTEEKFAKEIISFANTKGGKLIVGVDDDKTIVGIASEKEIFEFIDKVCQFYISPPINVDCEIINIEYKDVAVIHILESDQKPLRLLAQSPEELLNHRKAYVRQNDKTVAASKEFTKILQSSNPDAPPVSLSIGPNERYLFDYLEKNERVTSKEFAKLVNISPRRAMRLMVQLVRAGVLCIHTHEKTDYYTLFKEI